VEVDVGGTKRRQAAARARNRAGRQAATGRVRTPQQIWEDYQRTGNPADLALWQEYQEAVQGREAIEWSPGLRERLEGLEGSGRPESS
jgi:hypothetical protein